VPLIPAKLIYEELLILKIKLVDDGGYLAFEILVTSHTKIFEKIITVIWYIVNIKINSKIFEYSLRHC